MTLAAVRDAMDTGLAAARAGEPREERRMKAAGAGLNRRHGGAWALLLFLWAVPGCKKGGPTASADGGPAPSVRRYTVRGEVVRLPDPAGRGEEIFVRHEAIGDFVDGTGKVVGMASMIMPFRVEPRASAQVLALGDKVEIRFVVDWSRPAFRVERIEKLPASTPLRLGPAAERAGP
jgi:Cu/Ag efflux protein CusF